MKRSSSLCPVWRSRSDVSPAGSYPDLSKGSGPVTLLSSPLSESWKAKHFVLSAEEMSASQTCFLKLLVQINNLSCSWSRRWLVLLVTTMDVCWQLHAALVGDLQLTKHSRSISSAASMLNSYFHPVKSSSHVCVLSLAATSWGRLQPNDYRALTPPCWRWRSVHLQINSSWRNMWPKLIFSDLWLLSNVFMTVWASQIRPGHFHMSFIRITSKVTSVWTVMAHFIWLLVTWSCAMVTWPRNVFHTFRCCYLLLLIVHFFWHLVETGSMAKVCFKVKYLDLYN